MHEVEFVDQAAFLEELQGAVNRDTVELGILLLGKVKKAFGIEMLAGLIDQIEENLALACQAHRVTIV
jgi:hypothetical protein